MTIYPDGTMEQEEDISASHRGSSYTKTGVFPDVPLFLMNRLAHRNDHGEMQQEEEM